MAFATTVMISFTPGRKCKCKQLYLLNGEGEESDINEELVEKAEGEDHDPGIEVSALALIGTIVYHTIKIKGVVKKTQITIVIVGGSTNNFLDAEVANQVGCSDNRLLPLWYNSSKWE